MINASKAKEKTTINSKAKGILDRIEKEIMDAIERGEFCVNVRTALVDSDRYGYSDNKYIGNCIANKLKDLGYEVDIEFAKLSPPGCPSDQWDYENGSIKISWEK